MRNSLYLTALGIVMISCGTQQKTEKNKSIRKPYLLIAISNFSALQTTLPFCTSIVCFGDNFSPSEFSHDLKLYYLDTIFKKTF